MPSNQQGSASSSSNNFGLSPILVAAGAVIATTGVLYLLYKKRKPAGPPVTLEDPNKKYALPLIGKDNINYNTRRFRFGLPSDEHIIGLPIGQHIYLSAMVDGKLVVRPYTPVSADDVKGYVELIVKVYFANEHPKFPEGGKMTQYLEALSIGDTIDVRGPNGLCVYEGDGNFAIKEKKSSPPKKIQARKIGMLAGGTGVTPCYQLMQYILTRDAADLELWLIFANQREEDILMRDIFDDMEKNYPGRVHVWYTLDHPPEDWQYSSGFVSAEIIAGHFPPPGDDTFVLMCGPPPMINMACVPALDKLAYPPDRRFAY